MNIAEEIEKRKPWFHNLHLPDGQQTAPNHPLGDFPNFKWEEIKTALPEDMTGWSVLDVGCNAGFYSLKLAQRGAQVTGIDLGEHYLEQARWAARQYGLEHRVKFEQTQVYDLAHNPHQYDLVWFMGVFYHLRYPLLALDILAQKVKRLMVFQTLAMSGNEQMAIPDNLDFDDREIFHLKEWPKMAFVENKLAHDSTNWWVPNHQGVVSMLRSCGLEVTAQPAHETFVAAPAAHLLPAIESWNASEYLSATGQDWKNEVGEKTAEKNDKIK